MVDEAVTNDPPIRNPPSITPYPWAMGSEQSRAVNARSVENAHCHAAKARVASIGSELNLLSVGGQ